jgi:hypothetical protein
MALAMGLFPRKSAGRMPQSGEQADAIISMSRLFKKQSAMR